MDGQRPAVTPWAGVAETHTGVVFFAGERAYKVKKPVVMDVLDFRTREARLAACENEVALNRRLAPDVYLGVGELRSPVSGECGEPVVVMRRLPADRRLSALVARGDAGLRDAVRAIARLLASFHERCPRRDDVGGVEQWRALWRQGCGALAAHPDCVDPSVVEGIWGLASAYLDGRAGLFADRVSHGWVRDGHGDLLADDVFVMDDGPRVLDCLDFDERLRVGDVLLDVAFLAMDLERLGAPDLSRQLLDDYQEATAETHPASLQDFYVAYRALVRAKVAAVRAAQGRPESATESRALAGMTLEHLRAASVVLVLVGGLPGTGKTTLATRTATDRGWLVFSSDVVRKQLAGLSSGSGAAEWESGLYSPQVTDEVYDEMLTRADVALRAGESVVLDASWSDARRRERARRLGEASATVVVEVCCVVPDDVASDRLSRRVGDASDADAHIRRRMAQVFDDWPQALVVDTSGPVEEVEDLLREIALPT